MTERGPGGKIQPSHLQHVKILETLCGLWKCVRNEAGECSAKTRRELLVNVFLVVKAEK